MERKKYTNLYEAEKTISNRFVKIPRNSYWQCEGYNVTGSKSVSKALVVDTTFFERAAW